VTVRLFARLRDLVGASELEARVADAATVRDVWNELVRRYPDLAAYESSISCARNEEYAPMTTPAADGDEIAFLPPVSGG
jgi:molybdopterin converting factor subunit 1